MPETENQWEPIPETLEQAIERLRHFQGWEEAALKHTEIHFTSIAHFGVAISMRNNWRLHQSEPGTISGWFRRHRISEADMRSGFILKAFWHKANNKPFDAEKEIEALKSPFGFSI